MSLANHKLSVSDHSAIIGALRIAADEYAKTAAALSRDRDRNIKDGMKPEMVDYAIRTFGERAAEARSLADTLENAKSISITTEKDAKAG